jgi:hypothetical protein
LIAGKVVRLSGGPEPAKRLFPEPETIDCYDIPVNLQVDKSQHGLQLPGNMGYQLSGFHGHSTMHYLAKPEESSGGNLVSNGSGT